MSKRKRQIDLADYLRVSLNLNCEETLNLIVENFDILVGHFKTESIVLSKLTSVFSRGELIPAIVNSVGNEPEKLAHRLISLIVNFFPELLEGLTVDHQNLLIYCITDWVVISQEFESKLSLVDLHNGLKNLPQLFVSAITQSAFESEKDRRQGLLSLACYFAFDSESNPCDFARWKMPFILWFFEAYDSHLSASTIYRAIRHNLSCIHNNIATVLQGHLRAKQGHSRKYLFALVYIDSSLLLGNDSLPYSSRALFRLWICLAEILEQTLSEYKSSDMLADSRIGSLIDAITETWKRLGLSKQTDVGRLILNFVDKKALTLEQRAKFFFNMFCILGTLWSTPVNIDPLENLNFILRISLNLAGVKHRWDLLSGPNDHFLKDLVSIIQINLKTAEKLIDNESEHLSNIIGNLACLIRKYPGTYARINLEDNHRVLLLKIVCSNLEALQEALRIDGKMTDTLKPFFDVLIWIPETIAERLVADYNNLTRISDSAKSIRTLSAGLVTLAEIPQSTYSNAQFLPVAESSHVLSYVTEFGLGSKSEIGVYMRKGTEVVVTEIDKAWDAAMSATAVRITGSPGRGKSLSTVYWIIKAAFQRDIGVLWIHKTQSTAVVVIMRRYAMINFTVNIDEIGQLLKQCLCEVCVFDGASSADSNIVRSMRAWAVLGLRKKRMSIVVTSDGFDDSEKGATRIDVPAWTVSEFKSALLNETIKKSFLSLVNNDKVLKDRKGVDAESRFDENSLEELIDIKFGFSGGNARFMFAQTTDSVMKDIDDAIRRLPIREHGLDVGGKFSNTIFVHDSYGSRSFVSSYAQECFLSNRASVTALEQWQYAKQHGRNVLGTVFENLIANVLRQDGSLCLRYWDDVSGQTLEKLLENQYCIDYENESLMLGPISHRMKLAFASSMPPTRQGGNITCRMCPAGSKQFKTLENLDKHFSEKYHDDFFGQLDITSNVNMIEINVRNYLKSSAVPLDCVDLYTRNSNVWLIPKSNNPVFDFVHIRNTNEIWFIQATIATQHEISDYKFIRNVLNFIPFATNSTKIVFVHLSPVDSVCRFSKIQKTKLAEERIQFREMSTGGAFFNALKMNS